MSFFINNFNLLDEAESRTLVMNGIKSIFGFICGCLYGWISGLVDAMYKIAGVLNVDGQDISNFVANISDKLFVIILIYMIFRGTITMLNYIVDPESFQDKAKGGAAFIKRILVSIVLLISINPIFNLLGKVQDDIINSDIITSVFLSGTKSGMLQTESGKKVYLLYMSSWCGEDYRVITFSQGDHFALEAMKPFIQPVNFDEIYSKDRYDSQHTALIQDLGYCGIEITDEKLENGEIEFVDSSDWILESTLGFRSTPAQYMEEELINSGNSGVSTWGTYDLNFDFFFCFVVGIFVLLILISFTFDVVIRAFNLIVLKVLAPIPIIAYMSPKGKESDMLGTWAKKVLSTWASLFLRLIALSFALSVISFIFDANILSNNTLGLVESVLVVCGVLMFAKKLPQLLEEIIPGFKVGGFELNPFKRISKDALGGNMLLGAAAGAGAMALGAATNFGQRAVQGVNDMARATDTREALRAVFGGAARTVGSTVAGGARAGINAFNRTRKDGNLFGGLSKGYQTSMFSKKLREDNLRKVGILNDDGTYADGMGFMDSVRFGMSSVGADVARYAGVMNAGQREILDAAAQDREVQRMQTELSNRKRHDAEQKATELRPYELYTEQAVQIQNRLKTIVDNDSRVKDRQALLENAIARGDENDIRAAQRSLSAVKRQVRREAFRDDEILRDRMAELTTLQNTYSAQLAGYNLYKTENGQIIDVEDDTLANVQYRQAQITSRYKTYEEEYARQERAIEAFKNTEEYINAHNENSMQKMANASRMNGEIEGPGFKPASSGSSQAEITDEARFHLGRNANMASRARTTGGSGTNPPPPPPPPGGALH